MTKLPTITFALEIIVLCYGRQKRQKLYRKKKQKKRLPASAEKNMVFNVRPNFV
jgi:hypothetical protein